MIAVTDGKSSGYTVFYPGTPSGGRKYRARDLSSGMHYARSRVLFQVVVSCLCVLFRREADVLNIISVATFCYIAVTIFATKHISVDLSSHKWCYSLAPSLLWFDHFSRYSMLFVVVFVCNANGAIGNVFGTFGFFIEGAVVLIGLFPIFSYFMYIRNKHGLD